MHETVRFIYQACEQCTPVRGTDWYLVRIYTVMNDPKTSISTTVIMLKASVHGKLNQVDVHAKIETHTSTRLQQYLFKYLT